MSFHICPECGAENTSYHCDTCGRVERTAEQKLHDVLVFQRSVKRDLEMESLQREVARLKALINTPRTDDFFEAVRNEAAHQVERWGTEHDAGKRPEDWIALLVYLTGKATKAYYDGDGNKLRHHIVTVGAVCLNWLRNLNGETTAMRPGVGPTHAISTAKGGVR